MFILVELETIPKYNGQTESSQVSHWLNVNKKSLNVENKSKGLK